MKPELLKKYSSSFADAYSIGCLEINNIFSSGAVEILSQKISREERAHRQRVFSFYINGNNVDLCDSLLSRIRLFKKNYDEICRTDSKVKRIFGISKLTDAYGEVLKCAAQTDFGEEWKAYIECLSNEFTGMAEEIDDFRHNLEYFSSFSLIVSRNHYSVSRGNCFGDDDNFSDQLEIINRTLFGEDASAPGVVSAIPESIQVSIEQLFPERISALHSQAETISEKIHCEIIDYAEALSFYSEISHFSIRARFKGVSVCLPEFSDDGSLVIRQGYDITLINKVPSITPNDVYLDNTSNSAFVIGENGGGKTTFLRMIAVNCILACAGCPTFCESAVISAPQKIVALFPEPENADSGNFDSDVRRINVALADCDSGNCYFFNEPFSGTTEEKGLVYTVNLAKKITATSSRALIVTHFDKVTDYDFQIYSTFKSEDDPDAPEFVIKPYKRNDNSFAEVILKRYRLDKKSLGERAIQSVNMNEKPSI